MTKCRSVQVCLLYLLELVISHHRSTHGHSLAIIDDGMPLWMKKTLQALITLMHLDE
jgi:hypothetical protein